MISGNLYDQSIRRLVEAGIDKEDARFDIEYLEDVYNASGEASFVDAINRRCQGEPAAYIVGRKSFYKEEYNVVPGVLIPRSDTEILVEAALRYMGLINFPMGEVSRIPEGMSQDFYSIVDLCTGTGCVGISIAKELQRLGKEYSVVLGDVSEVAISCAQSNIELNNVAPNIEVKFIDVLHDDYGVVIGNNIDVIVSNPPYITEREMEDLPVDVKNYEPDLALRAGEDGLVFYRELASKSKRVLKSGGALIVEHGYLQGESVRDIFTEEGYADVITIKDYGNNDRVTIGRKG